jgi:tetratricopeptide (TPR) repeat protein
MAKPKSPRKTSRRTQVKGDVNITQGDLVAGDKSVTSGGDEDPNPEEDKSPKRKRLTRAKTRDVDGNLNVSGGDVVFGDKVIKFFQDTLNIYLFRDIKQLALFLTFVVFASGSLGGAYWYSKQPKKMTGNYNIAIAQFGEIQADGKIKPSAKAEKISNTLFTFLDSEYRASGLGLDVQVAHKNMPLILEDSQARELAEKVHADIVIYGNIFVQGDEAEFSPRFYVTEHPDTRELTGQDQLAHPIQFNISELGVSSTVNTQLRARTEILFNFTKALIYLSQKDFDMSLRAIKTAISAAEKLEQSFAGQEVLYLVATKIYIGRHDFDHATQMLDQALALNPSYARAYLGRGNIYYAQGTPPSPYNEGLLQMAKAEYEWASQALDQPEGAYIPIKAHIGLGNVYIVLAQAHNSDPELFTNAIEHYQYVVDVYQRTNDPFLRPFTALACFGMGGAYELQGNFDQAQAAYLQASELTDDQDFKDRISKRIAQLKTP